MEITHDSVEFHGESANRGAPPDGHPPAMATAAADEGSP